MATTRYINTPHDDERWPVFNARVAVTEEPTRDVQQKCLAGGLHGGLGALQVGGMIGLQKCRAWQDCISSWQFFAFHSFAPKYDQVLCPNT